MKQKGQLSPRHWSRLEKALRELYSPGLCTENFVERTLTAVNALVPGEFATYSRALRGAEGGFDIVFSGDVRPPLEVLMAYLRVKDRYELWKSDLKARDGGVLLLRDYFSKRQFRNLDIYATTYQPAGLDNHCAVPLWHEDGGDVFLSVQRQGGPDFTEAERALLGLLQPHLSNARALAHDRAATGDFQVEDFGGMGLTPREMEVFHWVVEGKRNAEIATILRLRLDTVKGHVERIFQKLHVENRHAAIRLGLQFVQQARRDEWQTHRENPQACFLKGNHGRGPGA